MKIALTFLLDCELGAMTSYRMSVHIEYVGRLAFCSLLWLLSVRQHETVPQPG